MEIQLVLNGEESGPHSLEEVQTLLANGDATLEDYAWFDGCADWITIAEIPAYQIVLEKKSRQRNPRLLPQRKCRHLCLARRSRRLGRSKYTRGCTGNDCQRRSCGNGLRCF